MSEYNDLLDLTDENDNTIGTIKRGEFYEADIKPGFIRAIDVFLVNSKGELWIPKRTAHKSIAPNGLDYSVGGHVDAGEDYKTALIREAQEEINLAIDESKLEFIAKSRRDDIGYFVELFAYLYDETPEFNPDDFVSASWITPNNLIALLKSGTTAKTYMTESANLLLSSEFYQNLIGETV